MKYYPWDNTIAKGKRTKRKKLAKIIFFLPLSFSDNKNSRT
jgi:hypothetical protein